MLDLLILFKTIRLVFNAGVHCRTSLTMLLVLFSVELNS